MSAAREYAMRHGRPDDATVAEIVRRVVEVADPDRIIMFGSAARGEMGRNSDLDFLVIKSGEYDRGRLEGDLYAAVGGVGIATDLILVTPEMVERYGYAKFLIIYPALDEGVEVYANPAPPTPVRTSRESASTEARRYAAVQRYPPDHPLEWLRLARTDLDAARLGPDTLVFEILCFHAQQAAEKALKAVLVDRSIDFPYTHDIRGLVTILNDTGVTCAVAPSDASLLTRYAALTRYPGFFDLITNDDYRTALQLAERLVEWADGEITTRD